ncbi:MAG: SDR family oxidoreductase [Leptonema sp. (in: Bacteria)]|nr:SDR family oxidoreductase [Leptonema sp. (in: bacteria)]
MTTRLLITGAGGYTGSQLIKKLKDDYNFEILATDVRFSNQQGREIRQVCDIRNKDEVLQMFQEFKPDAVVHLASIVTPGKKSNREFEYQVDVGGSENVLAACSATNVKRLIVTSSGAAYGYYADNSIPLTESDPIRGNYEFAYSYHKRLVEELLAKHKATGQLPEVVIFRVGTILGGTTNNQITALFEKKALPAIVGSDSPFVFVWDQDVIGAIHHSLIRNASDGFKSPAGIYNLAGDGWLKIDEIAAKLGKPVKRYSPTLLKVVFGILKPIGVSRYGPEQVRFLQYRPVLDNTALKTKFGYIPKKSSAEVFDYFCQVLQKRKTESIS